MTIKLGQHHSIDGLGVRRWAFPAHDGATVKVFDRGSIGYHGQYRAERFLVYLERSGVSVTDRYTATKPEAEQAVNDLLGRGVKLGDRITFRAATRWSGAKVTRVVNGFYMGQPTVRYGGHAEFIVNHDEIIGIEV
jgi:hypothetical protein